MAAEAGTECLGLFDAVAVAVIDSWGLAIGGSEGEIGDSLRAVEADAQAAAIRAVSLCPFSAIWASASMAVRLCVRVSSDSRAFISTVAQLGDPLGRPAPSRFPPRFAMV